MHPYSVVDAYNMACFLVFDKIGDLRYLKNYMHIMLFSGKVYRFYSEGLEMF